MRFAELLTILGVRNDVPALASQIANDVQVAAWEVVGTSIQGMSRHEAIGYVRARTRTLVKREVERHVEESFAQPNKMKHVFEAATQQLCELSLAQLNAQQTHRSHRQAA